MTQNGEKRRPDLEAPVGERGPDREFRRTNLGRLLIRAFDHFEDRILRGLHQHGFSEFRSSDTAILRNLDLEGTRVSEIARRARITPQAVSQHVRTLEQRGLVETGSDPDDGRARLIRFSDRGRALIRTGQKVTTELYAEWAEILGSEGLARLQSLLVDLVLTLDAEGGTG